MMQITGRLRIALVCAIILVSPAFRGAVVAADQPAGAEETATAETDETRQMLQKANEAFEQEDFLQASVLYRELVERNVDVPRDRYKKSNREADALYEKATTNLRKAADALDKWQVQQAQKAISVVEETGVPQVDATVRDSLTEAKSRLQEIGQKAPEQRQRAQDLLNAAEAAVAAGDYAQAQNALQAVSDLEVHGIDPAVRERTAALKQRTEQARAAASARQSEAARLLDSAEKNLEEANLDVTRRLLLAVEASATYRTEEDVKTRTDQLRARFDERWASVESRQKAAAAKLDEAREALEGREFAAAAEALQAANVSTVYDPEGELQQRADALSEELSEAQARAEKQRNEVEESLLAAEQALEEKDFDAARAALDEAAQQEIVQHDEDLQKQIQARRENLEKERTATAQRMQKVQEALEPVPAAIDAWEFAEAQKTLDQVKATDTYRVNEGIQKRVDGLYEDLARTRRHAADQKEYTDGHLDRAADLIEEGQTRKAQNVLEKVKLSPAAQRDEDLMARAEDLEKQAAGTVQEVAGTPEPEEKEEAAPAKEEVDRRVAGARLDGAEESIGRGEFDRAEEILGKVRQSKAYETDGAVRERTDALLARLEGERRVARNEAEQAERAQEVAGMLDDAEAQLAAGNLQAAQQLLSEARKSDAYQNTPALQEKGGRIQARLREEQQRRTEFERVLAQAKRQVEQENYDTAERLLGGLESSRLYRERADAQQRVATLREQIKQGRQAAKVTRGKTAQALEEAEGRIEAGRLAAAETMLEQVRQSEVFQKDAAVRDRVAALEARIEASREDMGEAQALLDAAEQDLEESRLGTARQKLQAAQAHPAVGRSEAMQKHLSRLTKKLEAGEKKSTEARTEFEEILDQAREKMEAGDPDAAAALLQKGKQSSHYRASEQARSRVAAAEQDLAEREKAAREAEAEKMRLADTRLKEADQHVAAREFDRAEDLLTAVRGSEAYETDEEVQERTDALAAKLEQERAAAEAEAEQRQKVVGMLQKAEDRLSGGDVEGARQLLEQARKTDVYQSSAALQTDGAQLQKRLREEQSRRAEFERILSQALEEVKQWDFEPADKLLAGLEASLLYKQRPAVREKVAAVRRQFEQAKQKAQEVTGQASALLDQAEQKIEAGDFASARELLAQARESEAYEQQPIRRRVSDLDSRLAKTRETVAMERYRAARTAYQNKDYAAALERIELAQQNQEPLSAQRQKDLAQMRQEVQAALERCRDLFERGQELYAAEQYQQAKETFEKIQAMDIVCSEDVEQGVEEHMAGIDVKIRAQKVARARQYEQEIAELSKKHEDILRQMQQRRQVRGEAMKHLSAARTAWANENFAGAKEDLLAADEKLQDLPVEKDPELQQAHEEVQEKLAAVDDRIAAQRRREMIEKQVENKFAQASDLREQNLQAAEQKMLEAMELAEEHRIGLSAEQESFVRDLNEDVLEQFGDKRRARADRYWALVEQADHYADDAEWQRALQMLQIVEQQDHIFLRAERREKFEDRLEKARTKATLREAALERLDEKVAEGRQQLQAGKSPQALQTYRQALQQAREEQVPLTEQVEILEGYKEALEKSRPKLMEEFAGQLEEVADEKIHRATTEKDYLLARAYFEAGSYRAAKDLLQKVARSGVLDEQKRAWAGEKLQGIDQKIQNLEEQRLLSVRDEAERLYNAQKEFEKAARQNDMEKIQQLQDRISHARVVHLVAKLNWALKRDAYPSASKMLEQNEQLVKSNRGNEELEEVIQPVRRYQRVKELVQQVIGALEQRKADAAASGVSELREVGVSDTPYEEVLPRLQEASTALVHLEAQKQAQNQRLSQTLSEVEGMLSQARARRGGLDAYVKANRLYARGNWTEALSTLGDLQESLEGLKPFEVERVHSMVVSAEEKRREMKLTQQEREAERLLADARQLIEAGHYDAAEATLNELKRLAIFEERKDIRRSAEDLDSRLKAVRMQSTADRYVSRISNLVESRHYREAADLIDEAKTTDVYREQKSVRRRIGALETQVREAEENAQELYSRATAAYEAGETERLEQLLDELRSKYKNTRVYAENL